MILNRHDLKKFEEYFAEVSTRNSFNALVLDFITSDWRSLEHRDMYSLRLILSKIINHPFYAMDTYGIMVDFLPSTNLTCYNSSSLAGFITELINSNYAIDGDISKLYQKFVNKSVLIAEAFAKSNNTPHSLLKELAYSEHYSVVATLYENHSEAAVELVQDPAIAQRILLSKMLVDTYKPSLT